MKKLKNILLSVLAIIAVAVFAPNVNATEVESDYVSNIVVAKSEDNTKYAIKFDLKKGISLEDNESSSIGVYWYYSKDGVNSYISNSGLKVIDGSAEFTQ